MLEKAQKALEETLVKKSAFLLGLDLQLFSDDPQDPPADPQDPPADDDLDDDPQDPPADPDKTFTQDDVNAIAAREAKKAQEKLLKQLGVKDFKTAKEGLEKFKEIQDSQMTEAEKQKATLKLLKDQNSTYEGQVKTMSAQLAAMKADVNPDSLDDVIVLANNLVNDETTIDDAIKSVLKKYPHFKRTQDAQDKKKPKFSDGEHKKDDKQSEEEKWLAAFKFGQ